MEEILSQIAGDWFLTEPLMFAAWCTHTLEENTKMSVPMRTGKMRIEYNPDVMKSWTRVEIEERLRFEVVRILLGHPYQRQPYKAKKATLGVASDVTLTASYHRIGTIKLPAGLQYEKGLCFEEYYAIVEAYLDKNLKSPKYDVEGLIDDGGGGSDDADTGGESGGESLPSQSEDKQMSLDELEDALSSIMNEDEDEETDTGDSDEEELKQIAEGAEESAELWEEDQLAQEQIKDMVRRAQRSKQWGSIGGGLKDEIEATTIVRIDYRTILSGFRASVLSSKRRLTRMIPSRRYGFQYMGSKRDFATRLLVAIDVSGSVDDKQVAQALSIINRFFKYGVENVDVIRFDVEVHGEPLSMNPRGASEYEESSEIYPD